MGGAVQHASIAAWNDEEHVRENRRFYVEKFKAAVPLLETSAGSRNARCKFLFVGENAYRR